VRAAYGHLGSTGLLRGRVGAGSFVNMPSPVPAPAGLPADGTAPRTDAPSAWARRARALEHEFAFWRYRPGLRHNLQYGEPFTDALLPEQWRNELARAALYTGPGYPPMQGLPALREAVCKYLRERRAVLATPDDVIIVASTGPVTVRAVLLDRATARSSSQATSRCARPCNTARVSACRWTRAGWSPTSCPRAAPG
jgi:GntR family transcriptional regulator/MocR family aminotransferase